MCALHMDEYRATKTRTKMDKNSKFSDIFYEIALFCAIFRQCWWIQMYMELLCRLYT